MVDTMKKFYFFAMSFLVNTFGFSETSASAKCECPTCICAKEPVKKKKTKTKSVTKPVYSKKFTEAPPNYYPYVAPPPPPVKEPEPKYVLREPKKEPCYKKHTVNFLLGIGQPGLITETDSDQYEFRRGGNGIIGGLLYQYHWSDTLNTGLGGFPFPPGNNTWFGSVGWSFDSPF